MRGRTETARRMETATTAASGMPAAAECIRRHAKRKADRANPQCQLPHDVLPLGCAAMQPRLCAAPRVAAVPKVTALGNEHITATWAPPASYRRCVRARDCYTGFSLSGYHFTIAAMFVEGAGLQAKIERSAAAPWRRGAICPPFSGPARSGSTGGECHTNITCPVERRWCC